MKPLKCVVVGDGAVGKTSLLISYAKNEFPKDYVPTVFENYDMNVMVGSNPYSISLYDTAGQEEYGRLRSISYPNTDIFLICFSTIRPTSLENVKEKWLPEILHHCPKAKYLIVGTQIDLREDSSTLARLATKNERPVSFEQGERLARELKSFKYLECSALTQKGLKSVFEQAILATTQSNSESKNKKRRCTII